MQDILAALQQAMPEHQITYFQSNHEGALIDHLYTLEDEGCDGVVLNAGGYTHTSVALADCLRTITLPVVEVHLSNIFAREDYRRHSMISSACVGIIAGLGPDVYEMGAKVIVRYCETKEL